MFNGSEFLSFLHRNKWLKERLARDYGDRLEFHSGATRKEGTMVTKKDIPLTNIVSFDDITTHVDSSGSSSSAPSSDSSTIRKLTLTSNPQQELLHTALHLRSTIKEQPAQQLFPPSPSKLNVSRCETAVPPELFRFICLATGLLDEHSITEDIDQIPHQSANKVSAICQDIVSLATSKTSPKGLALGLTVRHASGSKYLVDLLNGFGYSASYDAVLRAETSIAYEQLRNRTLGYLPPSFRRRTLTTL